MTVMRPRNSGVYVAAALLLTPLTGAQEAPTRGADPAWRCQLQRVESGNVVVLAAPGRTLRAQLAGVADPPAGAARQAAVSFLENLLSGEDLEVELSAGSSAAASDRPVAAQLYRAPDGLHVNLEAVRQGYAAVDASTPFERIELFRQYEQRARTARKGIWRKPAEGEPQAAPAGRAPEQPAPGETAGVVYVTKSGRKYHRAGCQYLSKSAQAIPLAEAVKRYEPCSRCKPPTRP